MTKTAQGHIFAIMTVFVWGMTFVCSKTLLEYLSPSAILLSRTVLGFLALCLIRPRGLKLKERKHELLFIVAALTGAFGYFLAENTALIYADASFVSVAVSTAPLFTAALGFVIFKKKGFGLHFVLGFVIAISGIALICLREGPGHVTAFGVFLCLLGALLWAVYSNVIKKLSDLGYETIAITKRTFSWALPVMIVVQLATEGLPPLEAYTHPIVVGNLLFLGLLASACCFMMWGFCVKHLGTAKTSAYIYVQAPITVVAAVILLGEPFTLPIAVGIVLTIVGLALSEGFFQNKKAPK